MSSLFELLPKQKFLSGIEMAGMPAAKQTDGAGPLVGEFYSTFKNVMGEVNRLQFNAEDQARAFAAGDVEDVHDVALAINKAKFALDLTVRVRDKLLDAYRELSQMR